MPRKKTAAADSLAPAGEERAGVRGPTDPAAAPNPPERGVHAASAPEAGRTVKRSKDRAPQAAARPSSLLDTRVIYCGDNLEQLRKLPTCVDLIYIDPPFNSNRNYEVFWGETQEKRDF